MNARLKNSWYDYKILLCLSCGLGFLRWKQSNAVEDQIGALNFDDHYFLANTVHFQYLDVSFEWSQEKPCHACEPSRTRDIEARANNLDRICLGICISKLLRCNVNALRCTCDNSTPVEASKIPSGTSSESRDSEDRFRVRPFYFATIANGASNTEPSHLPWSNLKAECLAVSDRGLLESRNGNVPFTGFLYVRKGGSRACSVPS